MRDATQSDVPVRHYCKAGTLGNLLQNFHRPSRRQAFGIEESMDE
jgi:hypothetical protein